MSNKSKKPKKTSQQLITEMKNKGISFKYITENEASKYLSDINNYFRTASYRKNFQKYNNGSNIGKYIDLDFSCLQELSTIDMHLRFLIIKMCLDIEHDLKVQVLKSIEIDDKTDGYDIVYEFLYNNNYIIQKLESISTSPFTSDLIKKYFTVQIETNPTNNKAENKIISYNDCPAWVLLEMLTFGDFIKFYEHYYNDNQKTTNKIPISNINLVKSLRNRAAHNNCILADLKSGDSCPPLNIRQAISKINNINKNQRQKKLSCRTILEFVALLYTYNLVVSNNVKYYRTTELKELFFKRMIQNKHFFIKNQLIKSNYDFSCKIIESLF